MFKLITCFYFREKTKKRERKISNRINAMFSIILLVIENDGHLTNHVTYYWTLRYSISCCYMPDKNVARVGILTVFS